MDHVSVPSGSSDGAVGADDTQNRLLRVSQRAVGGSAASTTLPPDPPANAWGYGARPPCAASALSRIVDLVGAVTRNPNIAGACYTQLYDVEQERNGLLTCDRRFKFPAEALRVAFSGESGPSGGKPGASPFLLPADR